MARRQPDEAPKHLTDCSKVQRLIEVLNQVEHIALGAAGWVPPSMAVMVDDDDLALAAAVFQGALGAFSNVQLPAADHAFQHGGAVHALPEHVQLRVRGLWHRGSPGLTGRTGRGPCPALSMPGICRTAGREAGGGQGRSRQSRAARRKAPDPCGPPGASGTASLLYVGNFHGLMMTGRCANGAPKITSEPALVPAASEVASILVVQDNGADVCKARRGWQRGHIWLRFGQLSVWENSWLCFDGHYQPAHSWIGGTHFRCWGPTGLRLPAMRRTALAGRALVTVRMTRCTLLGCFRASPVGQPNLYLQPLTAGDVERVERYIPFSPSLSASGCRRPVNNHEPLSKLSGSLLASWQKCGLPGLLAGKPAGSLAPMR